MAITIEEGVATTRLTNNNNNSSIEITTQKPESIISSSQTNTNTNDHHYSQNNIYHRSFSMTSLHYYGRPKKSRQEVARSMSTILSEQIPLEIIVPVYTTNNTTTPSSSTTSSTTTTKAYNTTTPTAAATNGDNKRTILIVVGVPENSNSRILKKYYSDSHFPYFQQNLTDTIAHYRKQPNTDIIHIHSSSSLSRSYYPSLSASTNNMSSLLLSRSIHHPNDNTSSAHSSHNNNKSSLHAVTGGGASNSSASASASHASSSHQLLRHQKDELLITKPIWSPSGNILLLKALERLSKRKIATNEYNKSNYLDPNPNQTASASTTTVLVCGLVTSVCVLQTANACREAGYTTHLIEDACADRDRIRHDQAVSFVEDRTCSHPI